MKVFSLILLFIADLFAQGGFVAVKNNKFYLGAKEYSFVGFNAYYLQSEAADLTRRYIVDDVLKTASANGIKVIRTWAFNEGDGKNAIRNSPYGYNASGLEALDYVIYSASKYNIRLILTLSNYYQDFGGLPQYLKWYEKQFNVSRTSVSDFYRNDTLKKWFKTYLLTVLERENKYTGIKYKNDPSIFSFELMNEGINTGDKGEIIAAWYSEMADYFKSIDSNHLLTTGEEGYDQYPQYYSDAGLFYNGADYLFSGYKGTSYYLNTQIRNIDYASFHLYPGLAGFSSIAGKTWMDDHQKIASLTGKPALPGELGVKQDKYLTYKYYFEELKKNGIKNCIVWQYLHKDVVNNDGFGFNEYNNKDIMDLCRGYAEWLDTASSNQVESVAETELFQNYPNPFNPVTTIRYSLKSDGYVKLTLYNALGEKVGVIDEGYRLSGIHERIISIQNQYMASGVYFCMLQAGGKTITRKIILQK